ncbi:hypothetical protein [Arthrobacter sp. H5]|uniref:hypothetical protein n=1 Tax=Arthrobacter sp. H5 TaxID=1267973 RepID=UPI000480E7D2|nr:hypothetical protein [Arthrobacter sp. H5]
MEQSTGSCCSPKPSTTPSTETQAQDLHLGTRPQQGENAIAYCPVMVGTPVVKAEAEAKGLFRDYDGERFWLCCAGCGPAFDAEPAEYAHAS